MLKQQDLPSIILGAVLAVLAAIGLVTAEEGASLGTYGTQTISGIIGIVEIVRGIIARRKGGKGKPATPAIENTGTDGFIENTGLDK